MAESIPWGTGPGRRGAFMTLPGAAGLAALPPDDRSRGGGEMPQ
jgi:hypothetical protein